MWFIDLQDTTLALDFRVTVLEENGGDDGNSSVAELELRVETLEGTAADHETRISSTETVISGTAFLWIQCILNLTFNKYLTVNYVNLYYSDLEEAVADQESRLTTTEENIQGKF